MKPKKIIILLFILSLVFYNGCKKDLVGPEYFDSDVYSYLPLKIGNYWEYEYTDIALRAIVKREIKNKVTHEDGSIIFGYYEGLVSSNPNPIEPVNGYYSDKDNAIYYYSSSKDTMVISGTTILTQKTPILKMPLSIGAYWIVASDTFKIESFSSINIDEKIYNQTILVVTRNNISIDSTWFSKEIGIVRRKVFNSNSFVEMKLKSYSLN